MVYQALLTSGIVDTRDNLENMQKIAMSIYQIMITQIYHLLWTTYLKSGKGQLISSANEQLMYPTNLPIWPTEIKVMIELKDIDQADKNETCLNFVNYQLHELDNQLKQYKTELNIKANDFQGYSLTIQQRVEAYVANHIHPLHMEIEHQMELIQYDYHIRALKLEYLQHKPTIYQVCLS